MVAPVSNNTALLASLQTPASAPSSNSSASFGSTSATLTGPAQPKKTVSAETERYTAVQQSLSSAKSAISAADTANKQIDGSLKQVRDIATQLSNDNLASQDREKLQADYQKLRDGIIKSQEQATIRTGDKKSVEQKTNLLTDDKALTTATNTRGGQLDIQSSQSAKALGLPEKLGSASDAKALLQGNENQAGSLANAEKNTRDTATRLKKVEANVDQKFETSSAVAKAVRRLDAAKNGGIEVSTEREQLRTQALEKARETSQMLKSQLSGISPNNSSGATNPLLGLLR